MDGRYDNKEGNKNVGNKNVMNDKGKNKYWRLKK